GDRDRVSLVVEGDDDEDGTEDLLLGDRHRVVDVDEQCRLHAEALVDTGRRIGSADASPPRRCPAGRTRARARAAWTRSPAHTASPALAGRRARCPRTSP